MRAAQASQNRACGASTWRHEADLAAVVRGWCSWRRCCFRHRPLTSSFMQLLADSKAPYRVVWVVNGWFLISTQWWISCTSMLEFRKPYLKSSSSRKLSCNAEFMVNRTVSDSYSAVIIHQDSTYKTTRSAQTCSNTSVWSGATLSCLAISAPTIISVAQQYMRQQSIGSLYSSSRCCNLSLMLDRSRLPETLRAEDSVVHGNAKRHSGNRRRFILLTSSLWQLWSYNFGYYFMVVTRCGYSFWCCY